ncbi:Flp pilus assembly protein CpaB [Lysobacter korlensis]|uniref:Flp pilus assembly protein CpaB n=2 Tax=Lysobacter korlensis TaxID=553636 RepID=A0ABV6RII0_9GAMM
MIVALVLAAIASLVAVRYVQTVVAEKTRDDQVLMEVTVPNEDLPQGTILREDQLSLRAVPADFVPADALTPENYEMYAGRVLRNAVRAGAPLSAGALSPLYDQFSRVIPKGKVAYTLSVDENNSISGMIAPGDMIDILFLKDGESGREGARLFPLLQQIKVLATGTRVGEKVTPEVEGAPDVEGYSSVTLELDHYQAKQLAVASKAGNLRVLLREITDNSPGMANGLSERDLLRSLGGEGSAPARARAAQASGIEFIIGGRG